MNLSSEKDIGIMKKDNKGFSVIGILISFVLVTLGLLISLIYDSKFTDVSLYLDMKSKANLIAEQELESLYLASENKHLLNPKELIKNKDETVVIENRQFNKKVKVFDNLPMKGMKTIQVIVSWRDQEQQQKSTELEMYLFNS